MPLNRDRAQKYLQTFDFESLFIEELGWDTVDRVTLPFEVDGELLDVVAIAQKRGFTVFKCITSEIPARPLRVTLDRQLTDYSKSHLLVFGDEGKTQQTWMWVRQELGKPLAPRFEQYQVGQTAERLLQKLEALAIAFAEEEKLTLVEVAQRVKKAFDVEKVTKKFFTRFEKEHGQFLKFIDDERSEAIYIHRIVRYFIKALSFIPLFIATDGSQGKSDDYKKFCFIESEREIIIPLLNSSLFYWFWRTHSDGFHCGFNDVYLMPYHREIKSETRSRSITFGRDLMRAFQDYSSIKSISTQKGAIQYQEFSPKAAKPIIDEIDRVLAQHYGFTAEELDDLINYDIKYRMGRDNGGDE